MYLRCTHSSNLSLLKLCNSLCIEIHKLQVSDSILYMSDMDANPVRNENVNVYCSHLTYFHRITKAKPVTGLGEFDHCVVGG